MSRHELTVETLCNSSLLKPNNPSAKSNAVENFGTVHDDDFLQSDDELDEQISSIADGLISALGSPPVNVLKAKANFRFTEQDPVVCSAGPSTGCAAVQTVGTEQATRRTHTDGTTLSQVIGTTVLHFVDEYDVPSERTPPSRSSKQNMREVDANEDYGGALLSKAERQLMSMYTCFNSGCPLDFVIISLVFREVGVMADDPQIKRP